MIIRFKGWFFLFGLLLCSCDKSKPELSETKNHERSTTEHRHAIRDLSSTQIAQTPRERLDAADRIEKIEERDKVLSALVWDTMETDPEVAHPAFLKLTPDSEQKIRLIRHYAMRLAAFNPDQAVEWAGSFESPIEFTAAITQIAVALAEEKPESAVSLLTESEVSGRDLDVAIVQVIQRWAVKSPSNAADWLSQFPSGEVRLAGLRAVTERWLPADPAAAFKWYNEIHDDLLRKEAARSIEGWMLQQNPTIREQSLGYATPEICKDLEDQRAIAITDIGDNIQTFPQHPIE